MEERSFLKAGGGISTPVAAGSLLTEQMFPLYISIL